MKQVILFSLLLMAVCGVLAQTQKDSRLKIKEYVDKEILIVDRSAGQSITLVQEHKDYYIMRKFFGSGVPVVAYAKYKVKFDSDYQITFSEIAESSSTEKNKLPLKEEFVLTVANNGLMLYQNGLKVMIQ